MPPGTSFPAITLTVNVAANATSPLVNLAVVAGGGDLNGANNSSSDPVTIDLAAAPDAGDDPGDVTCCPRPCSALVLAILGAAGIGRRGVVAERSRRC